jgi:lysyl-tRNA synthetase class 1
MFWLTKLVDEVLQTHKSGEFVISSGVSPSGPYHVGTLREVLTAEAVARELRRRGLKAKHIHVSDDMDVFRKVPMNIAEEYQKYLGKPLCDIPAPGEGASSYADYYLRDLPQAAQGMMLDMEILRASEKYRSGFFTEAIEKALTNIDAIKSSLEKISGRKLDESWAPIQILEDGYLKNRRFVSIDTTTKRITYLDPEDKEQTVG